MKKWATLALLGASTFIIVIDTTIMNVSISQLVIDLNTTVGGVQSAISIYALVMASFILIGGKLADIIGKKRTFLIGVAIFGVGTTIASFSQSLGVLIFGWSLLEGLGSALMLPNIQTLLRDAYDGEDRAVSIDGDLHTDSRAAESARAVDALAYTVGQNVVFGVGQYAPATSHGRQLIAHELTHVAQQTLGSCAWRIQTTPAHRKPAAEPTANKPPLPVSYTQNAAAPPKIDFGKVRPGTTGFAEGAIYNLFPVSANVFISYEGDAVIQIVSRPTRIRENSVQMAHADRTVKLVFHSPTMGGSYYGTLTIGLVWDSGLPPERLTVPVVAHALEMSESTPDEKLAEGQRRKEISDREANLAKQQAEEKLRLEDFSKKHPKVETDKFNEARLLLLRAWDTLREYELAGVDIAEKEVGAYKKEPPPAESTLLFDLGMLVIDIASAGIAGVIARRLDTFLRARKDVDPILPKIRPKYEQPFTFVESGARVKSEAAIVMITESIKESIKGTSKLVRKQAAMSDPGSRGADDSADPRIRFFQYLRNALIGIKEDRDKAFLENIKPLRPIVFENEDKAIKMVEAMTDSVRAGHKDADNIYAATAVRKWIDHISQIRTPSALDVNRVGTVQGRGIRAVDGVVDIGFQAGVEPHDPVVVRSAIIRGISNAVAHRLQRRPLLELEVPVRAYGLPSPKKAELLVTVIRDSNGDISWIDKTYGSAPPSSYSWLRAKGGSGGQALGAKILIEREIMSKSLNSHGVSLTTDSDDETQIARD